MLLSSDQPPAPSSLYHPSPLFIYLFILSRSQSYRSHVPRGRCYSAIEKVIKVKEDEAKNDGEQREGRITSASKRQDSRERWRLWERKEYWAQCVSENENLELREQKGGRRDERGWRTGREREREGESFITVVGGSALRAAGAGGTLTFLSFHWI